MENTTVSTREALSLLTKAVKHYFVWGICVALADAIVGWFFERTFAFKVIWFAIAVITFVKLVVTPTRNDYKELSGDTDTLAPAEEDHEMEELPAPDTKISQETFDLRAERSADISSCFSNSSYRWNWANRQTVDRIYIYPLEQCATLIGNLVFNKQGRIEAVEFNHGEKAIRLENKPLLFLAQKEQLQQDAPIAQFLRANLPDAQWQRIGEDEVLLSSVSKGVENAKGIIHYDDNSTRITFITLTTEDGRKKFIRPKNANKGKTRSMTGSGKTTGKGDTSTVKTNDKTGIVTEEHEDFKKVNYSETTSSIIATAEPTPPVDVQLSAEEIRANLLRPTDTPPIPDDDLRRAANLQADYDSLTLSELAMSAEAAGESSFIIKWPEGLQTKKETEFYAEALVTRAGFRRVDILAETMTMRVHLELADEYCLEDYAPD